MRLHSRIYLHTLVVLLVVVAATSLVFALAGRGAPAREIAERLARHAASIAGETAGDRDALVRRIEQLQRDLGIDVAVRSLDGRTLAAAGGRAPGPSGGGAPRPSTGHASRPASDALPPVPPDMDAAVRDGRVVSRLHPTPWALAPVRDAASGQVVGSASVVIHRHLGPAHLTGPLLTVAIVLLVVAVATRPLARRLARPLETLTAVARRLAGGELSARVPLDTRPRRGWRRRGAQADELRELTLAFNEMADRVERLVRGHKELLANVSHELRSPLARIRVALELLPRDGDADDARLRDIESDLAELDRLIEDVLATARLEVAGLPTSLASIDVPALLASLAERAHRDPMLAGKEVRVAEAPVVAVVGDERLLRRALWNLVENAAKYGAAPITLTAGRDGNLAMLRVSDEGPGIPAEARERVLDAFQRLDPARTPAHGGSSGFGLGLTLARRVAEAHGGSVTIGPAVVERGVEHGCTVTLAIPVAGPTGASR